MKKIFLSVLKKIAPVLLLSTAMQASAAIVTTIHTGLASGSLDGVAFENAYFAITAVADTSTITSCGTGCLSNINLNTFITIAPFGALNLITPTNYVSDTSGIAFTYADNTNLFKSPTNVGWDMASSLPPVMGFDNAHWTLTNLVTTGGVLLFNEGVTSSAFTATAVSEVPAPAGIWLLGSGLVGLVGVARRKA